MTALPVAARHSSFSSPSASAGLLTTFAATYRRTMSKVMAQTPPRQSPVRARIAAQANVLLRDHNALGLQSL